MAKKSTQDGREAPKVRQRCGQGAGLAECAGLLGRIKEGLQTFRLQIPGLIENLTKEKVSTELANGCKRPGFDGSTRRPELGGGSLRAFRRADKLDSRPLVLLGRPLGLLGLPEGVPGGSRGALWRSGGGPWGALGGA